MNILERLQDDMAARLASDPLLTLVTVLNQRKGVVESDVATALGAMNADAGKRPGAVLIVLTPQVETPENQRNMAGPQLQVSLTVQCLEMPLVNRTPEGTGITIEALILAVQASLHQWFDSASPQCLAHNRTQPIDAEDGLLSYAVEFGRMLAVNPSPRAQDPVISVGMANEITITCGTPDAVIRYTEDGSYPDLAADIYTDPLTPSSHTIRAVAYASGLQPSRSTTASLN